MSKCLYDDTFYVEKSGILSLGVALHQAVQLCCYWRGAKEGRFGPSGDTRISMHRYIVMKRTVHIPDSRFWRRCTLPALGLAVAGGLVLSPSETADARRIENNKAVFAALDKVTARISRLEVGLDETSQFGALKITPRVCYSREPTEPPKTTAFVEVTEIKLDGTERRLFSGWMFAQSPGLSAVEHPVFDVWLTDCMGGAAATNEQGTQKKIRKRRKKRRR